MLKLTQLIVFSFVFLSVPISAAPTIGAPAPVFTGLNSNGEMVKISDFLGTPVVLEWTNHECPYVKKHYDSGNMQKTQKTLTEQGAVWISIISSAPGKQGHVTAKKANELTTSRGVYADMVILDESGEIGRTYGAVTSPHMFLIGSDGILKYMGAIDDKPSARPSSLNGAENYVLSAWDAYQSDAEIVNASTKPYGCSVKYAD